MTMRDTVMDGSKNFNYLRFRKRFPKGSIYSVPFNNELFREITSLKGSPETALQPPRLAMRTGERCA